jgi:hypothetical protein
VAYLADVVDRVLQVVDGGITVELFGYSPEWSASPNRCGCAPDQRWTLSWRWSDGSVTRTGPRPIPAGR